MYIASRNTSLCYPERLTLLQTTHKTQILGFLFSALIPFGQERRNIDCTDWMCCWLLWVVYHVYILSVLRPPCKCKCMTDVLPKRSVMFSYRSHKIALNVITSPLSPIICESSMRLLYMCEPYFFFPWKSTSLKRSHVAESNHWHWVCQLSLTVGLQPLPVAALKGGRGSDPNPRPPSSLGYLTRSNQLARTWYVQ